LCHLAIALFLAGQISGHVAGQSSFSSHFNNIDENLTSPRKVVLNNIKIVSYE